MAFIKYRGNTTSPGTWLTQPAAASAPLTNLDIDKNFASLDAQKLDLAGGTLSGTLIASTYISANLKDDSVYFVDNADTSKKLAFQVSGVTTSSTVTLTVPNTNGTIALTSDTIPATNGGTGITTYAAGDILYASATNTLAKLAKGANGEVLKLVNGVPSWAADTDTDTLLSIAETTTNADHYIGFFTSSSGAQSGKVDSSLLYNPATNTLKGVSVYGGDTSITIQPDAKTTGNTSGSLTRLYGGTASGTGTGGGINVYSGNGSTNQLATSGNGGAIHIKAGDGSRNSDAVGSLVGIGGDGGDISITAGSEAAQYNANGAKIVLLGATAATYTGGSATISGGNAIGGTNRSGGGITIEGGLSTGSGSSGDFLVKLSKPGASGSNINALTDVFKIASATGKITTGEWSATTIAPTVGGTGITTYAAGDILYASAANTLAKLAKGTDGQVLKLASGVPSWAADNDTNTDTLQSISATTSASTHYISFVGSTTGTQIGYVNTNITVTPSTGTISATNFDSTSDIRFKSELETISNALDKVKTLTGYTFTMIETGQRSTGLTAQDVEKVLPEAVGGDENKKTVNYGAMMGLIIESIKELNSKLEDIQNQLNNK